MTDKIILKKRIVKHPKIFKKFDFNYVVVDDLAAQKERLIRNWIRSKGKEPTLKNAKNLFRRYGVKCYIDKSPGLETCRTKKGEVIYIYKPFAFIMPGK